jgi:hypothetical protein
VLASVPARLGAFAVGVMVVFVAAFGLGRAVGPVGDDPPSTTSTTAPSSTDGHTTDGHGSGP